MPLEYHPRAYLKDPSWFYGRQNELRRLFSYLNGASPQNVSVVGQRRIGKSWLLKVIALDKELQAKFLTAPDKYTFIYWDLQSEPSLSPALFFKRLIELTLIHLPKKLTDECGKVFDEDDPEESLTQMLDLLEIAEQRVILLLDEFAAITRNPTFVESFFSHLRSIFDRAEMTCVTASYRSLGEMCHLGPDSPFFNIFSRIQLGLLTNEEARGFILEPFQAKGITVEDGAVREILRLTGPHPCFISQLGYDLSNEIKTSVLTAADVQPFNGSFQTSIRDDYDYYMQRLDKNEQDMLRNIAEGNIPVTSENPIFIRLESLSLVRRYANQFIPFSVPFGQFVKEQRGTDLYFSQAFADSTMSGPSFIRIAEVMLASTQYIPKIMREDLESAIRSMQGRPQDAMATCGRAVLDPLLKVVAKQGCNLDYNTRLQIQADIIQTLDQLAYDSNRIPKSYIAHFYSIKASGNHGAHPEDHREACTSARAFLTVLETIHLAEEVFKRYGGK